MLDISAAGIAPSPPLATRAAISAAAQNLAALKNVSLTVDERQKFVDLIINEIGLAHILFSCMDPDVVTARSRIISHQLNVLAVARVMEFVAGVEGKESILEPVVQAITGEIIRKFEGNVPDMGSVRWPPPLELVQEHYAGKLRGPTVAVREDGTVVTRWWKGLEVHRDPSDGPASIEVRGSYRREQYRVDGKRHRPWQDGPAEVITDVIEGKNHYVEAYWYEGQRHRPHTEGPAHIVAHYNDNTNLSGEEYYEHGKLHRPSHTGPAVTHWDSSGRKTLEEFFEDGELHRDPKEGPAAFAIRDPVSFKAADDNVTITRYCVRGQSHRDEEDGPAFTVRDNVTGVLLQEGFDFNGRSYRKNGAALINRNADGKITFEAWCDESGAFSRDPSEGPAVTSCDSETGITTEEFIVNGEYVAPPLVALIRRDASGTIIDRPLQPAPIADGAEG